jgi:chaperonin GroEL
LIPLLEDVRRSEKPLLIIADELEGEVMQLLLINRTKGNFPIVAVRSPAYGSLQSALLDDVCVLANTKPFDSSMGTKLESLRAKDLGRVKRVVVTNRTTSIVADPAAKARVDERLDQLRSQVQDPTLNPDDAKDLKLRIAKLSAGAAVIKVGGATEVEMIERKHRIEDALHATNAAVEEGMLPGGGASLVRARKAIVGTQNGSSESFIAGTKAVWEVCAKPLEALAASSDAGYQGLIEKLSGAPGTSYDVLGDRVVDAFETGILDPAKVTRLALENAVSVATAFVSLNAVVAEEDGE